MVPTLVLQSRLSIVELDNFLSQFIATYSKHTTKDVPASENADTPVNPNDINLKDKEGILQETVNTFEISIKRSRKSTETFSLTESDKWRVKQFVDHTLNIRSFRTDDDIAKRNAAILYEPLLEQFKNIHSLTNSAQTALIEKYVTVIQSEKYKSAYDTLGLEARTASLKKTNDEYKKKSLERANEEKNRVDSPTDCRQKCIAAYRNLVSLINFTEENNKSLFYTDMINELSAQTIVAQELINRRANAAKKKKEETTPKTLNMEPGNDSPELLEEMNN